MSGARFRYALEPVRLTRQWDLDALMLELTEHNASIATQQAREDEVRDKMKLAAIEWSAMTSDGQELSVGRFMLANRYMGELSRQARELAGVMAELVQLRDALIERVVLAQRALDAAEQHRDEMKTQFVRQRLSGEFKVADDQWNTQHAGALLNGG